jgi:putative transposase
MATITSPSTGRRYGIAEVCRIWDVPRSSFYADRHRANTTTPVPAQRRGPKPVVSDDALLAAIRADLARSPWHARDIARCGPDCGSWTVSGSRANECCD